MGKSKLDDNYTIETKEKRRLQAKAAKILATIALAKDDFWYFLKAIDPSFFNNNKEYIKKLAAELNEFYYVDAEELDTLLVNMPPRCGKTYILILYEVWCKLKNPQSKSIVVCYNENLSLNFSKSVRNFISEPKMNRYKIVPNDVFPGIYIKKGSASVRMWSLNKSNEVNFLATSPGGTVTGMAAGATKGNKKGGNIIIDDLIKSAYEAFNERILEEHWSYFTQTLFSRREKNSKLIICFTRWSPNDLVGCYERWAKENKKKYKKIVFKMEQPNGEPLDSSIMSKAEMLERKSIIGDLIWKANYQQEPELIENKLYTDLRAYLNSELEKEEYPQIKEIIPPKSQLNQIYCVCDPADSGKDYTCAIAFTVFNGKIFILDVLYTQEKMETTEILLSKFLHNNQVIHCVIENNNGGEGFARNIARILREELRNNFTQIETFHQTNNKAARIFANASDVQRLIYFPYCWFTRINDVGQYVICEDKEKKDYIDHLLSFVSVKDSEHDDAEDATTLIIEFCVKNQLVF
jgi:predicted phage terminase large subunit-like protein